MSKSQIIPNFDLTTATCDEENDRLVQLSSSTSVLWGKTSLRDRAKALRSVADALDAAAEQLIEIARTETNLTQGRLDGELKRTTFQLRLFAEQLDDGSFLDARIDHADPQWPMGAPRPDIRRVHLPLGPVVVFAASNFPFAFSVAGGDTASALAAGCPVILKAHSGHLRLSQATAEIVQYALENAGAPHGVFTAISGAAGGVRALLNPLVKAGAFTGSTDVGRMLFDHAQSRPEPIPFYGELGSSNPVFVTPAAVTERGDSIAQELVASFTMSAGQLCTKPGLVFIPRGTDLVDKVRRIQFPPATPLLNKRVNDGYVDSLASLVADAKIDILRGTAYHAGDAPEPTILRTSVQQILDGGEHLLEECFGPTTLLIEYSGPEELLEMARSLEGQLTATIQGSKGDDVAELVEILTRKAGRVLWNEWPTGVSVTYAQQHGGPYPATTTHTTSVGTAAISRFLRPVAFQNMPDALLPDALKDANPLGISRLVNGERR